MFPNNTPYTDLHEINLNKFLKAIKNLLGGHGGEYLKKKSNIPFDYEWTNIEVESGVNSVNGQTGDVSLDYRDVGALPDTYTPPPAPVQSVNGQTGAVSLDYQDVGALPDTYTPPPAPVQSVNGQTGAVSLDYQDVGALPDTYTPPPAPVQSVNGQTGAVVLNANDVGALPNTYDPLSNLTYSQTGLSGNFNIVSGGYCKIGALVIVNMRMSLTADAPISSILLSGLPNPVTSTSYVTNISPVTNTTASVITLNGRGELTIPSSGGGGVLIPSGSNIMIAVTYISRD